MSKRAAAVALIATLLVWARVRAVEARVQRLADEVYLDMLRRIQDRDSLRAVSQR